MISYERIIQWLSGPVSILAGFGATQLVGVPHGAQHDALASAISQIGEFGVAAGVTYLAHHKFLTNVAQWWNHQAYAAAVAPAVTHDAPVVAHDLPPIVVETTAVPADVWPAAPPEVTP